MGIIEGIIGKAEAGTMIEAERRITIGGEIETMKIEMIIGNPEIKEISNYIIIQP